TPSAARLSEINRSIAATKAHLEHTRLDQAQAQSALKATEAASQHLMNALTHTQEKLTQTTAHLHDLQTQTAEARAALTTQNHILIQLLQATYMLGNTPSWQIWLSGRDLTTTTRLQIYANAISTALTDTLTKWQKTVNWLMYLTESTSRHSAVLFELQQQQKTTQVELNHTLSEREQLLVQLHEEVSTETQTLRQLEADKLALEKMLTRLIQQAAKRAHTQGGGIFWTGDFRRAHGHLPWPVKGPIMHHFGASIHGSELTWNGVVISAPLNQPVRAIAAGQVVFADWMSGYGFLIIVNQGHGFMTLYGRNRVLYKHTGDTVRPGETISLIGESGGLDQPGLYFAIREGTKSVNPELWLTH
ncbi:MAG: hypothetical protein A3J38_03950, partial [Gammaproteobacteria bacterium RIFCSPHIGHO2_12_FULL_45_9]